MIFELFGSGRPARQQTKDRRRKSRRGDTRSYWSSKTEHTYQERAAFEVKVRTKKTPESSGQVTLRMNSTKMPQKLPIEVTSRPKRPETKASRNLSVSGHDPGGRHPVSMSPALCGAASTCVRRNLSGDTSLVGILLVIFCGTSAETSPGKLPPGDPDR